MTEPLFNPFVPGIKISDELISKTKGYYEYVVPWLEDPPLGETNSQRSISFGSDISESISKQYFGALIWDPRSKSFLRNWALYKPDEIDPKCHDSLKNPLLKPFFTASCRIFNLENNILQCQSGIFVTPTLILSTNHFAKWKGEMPTVQELDHYKTNPSSLTVSNSINGRYSSFSGRSCKLVWYNIPSELCLFELLDLTKGEPFIPLSSLSLVDVNASHMNGKRVFTCGYNETDPNNEVANWASECAATLSPPTLNVVRQVWNTFSFKDCFHPDDKSATTGKILPPPSVTLVPQIDNKPVIAPNYAWAQLPTWHGHSGAPVILEEDMKVIGLVVGAHLNAEPTRVIPFSEDALFSLSSFVGTRPVNV